MRGRAIATTLLVACTLSPASAVAQEQPTGTPEVHIHAFVSQGLMKTSANNYLTNSERGSAELTDRVVAVGKRLSNRLYLSYEQGIGAVASNLIKLDYALGRRWTLRAETGSSSGGGLFYRYSWD